MKKIALLALMLAGMFVMNGCGKTCHDCNKCCSFCEPCPSGCYDADGECNN